MGSRAYLVYSLYGIGNVYHDNYVIKSAGRNTVYCNFSHALNLYLQLGSWQLKVTNESRYSISVTGSSFSVTELRPREILVSITFEYVFVGFWWLVTRCFD